MEVRPDLEAGEPLALRLPAQDHSVPIARRAAVQYAEEVGADPETLWRIRLAVSEALTNVVLHAYRDTDRPEEDQIVLTALREECRIVITVADQGSGLRPRQDSPGMGFGLSLIAQTCDELRLETDATGGTVVQMGFEAWNAAHSR